MSKVDNVTADPVVIHDTVTVTKFKEKPLIIVCKDSLKKDSLTSPPIFVPNDTALRESIKENNKLMFKNIQISLSINDSTIFTDTIKTSGFNIDSDVGLVE